MTDELDALTGAFALDAVDDIARARFERLAGDRARDEVCSLQATAAELSVLAEAAPPPELRAAVLSAIAQVRPSAAVPVPRVVRRSHRGWQFVAAACVALLVTALAWGRVQSRSADHRATAVAQLRSLLASGATTTEPTHIGSGTAVVLYSRAQRKLVVVGWGVPAVSSAKTYQLWTMTSDGVATSVGTFRPDGHGDVLVQSSADLSHAAVVGVSIEHAGGAAVPTPTAVVTTIAL